MSAQTQPRPPKGEMIPRSKFREFGLITDRTTIQKWIDERGFPKPYRFGYRTVVWSLDEIRNWMAAQRAA
jgi:hypothetical protein